MAKRVHAKSQDFRFVTKLIQTGIIGAIFIRHTTNRRLDSVDIPLPIVSADIRRQVCAHVLLPRFEPCVHSHVRWTQNAVIAYLQAGLLPINSVPPEA